MSRIQEGQVSCEVKHQDWCNALRKQQKPYSSDPHLPCNCGADNIRLVMYKLEQNLNAHKAARIAYANEFPPDENGEPDVENIHQNIRNLKHSHSVLKAAVLNIAKLCPGKDLCARVTCGACDALCPVLEVRLATKLLSDTEEIHTRCPACGSMGAQVSARWADRCTLCEGISVETMEDQL